MSSNRFTRPDSPATAKSGSSVEPDAARVLIKLRGLTKAYREAGREHVVLREVNAAINEGEFVVLLGRSGSGKSTLLNLISGIDYPTHGEISVAGECITRLSERQRTLFRRRHIGFIFQSFNLIPTLSVLENLMLPLEINGVSAPQAKQRALGLLERLDLPDCVQSFPDRLSGGEQQRVAIARALVHDPLLVLADEPTGNLDLETGRQVLHLLDQLTREAGRTMLMVTHSREVVGLADRIMTIADSSLVESGSKGLPGPSGRQND